MALQVDQLRWMAERHGDETAYAQLASKDLLTFARWDTTSNRLARGLAASGVGRASGCVLHLDNEHLDRWLISYAAIHKAGAVAVPTNTRLTARELSTILAHAEPVAVITSTRLRPTLDEALARAASASPLVVDAADHESWCSTLSPDDDTFQVPVDDGDLADIMYTSGTTGLPKGVAVRHRNTHMIPNGEPRWTGDSWIHCSPLSTFAGISFVYNPMKMGMRGLYLPRFDADPWFDAVEQWRPTMAFLVPAMVQLLLAHERFATADLSSLTLLSIGSAPLAPTLHRRVAERLPDAMVTNNYSMTEAGTAFTYLPPGEITRRPGSVGMPLPPTEIRIADDDGEPLPTGEMGEVLIGVGEHHREYYRDPEATAPHVVRRVAALGRPRLPRRRRLPLHRRAGQGHHHPRRQQHRRHRGRRRAVRARRRARGRGGRRPPRRARRGRRRLRGGPARRRPRRRRAACVLRRAPGRLQGAPRIWFVDELPRNATGKVLKRDLVPPD